MANSKIAPPSGKVTFLFTDIEGSTRLAQEFQEKLNESLQIHNAVLHEAIESNNGYIFRIVGDAFCSSFGDAASAIRASVEIQKKLNNVIWDEAAIKIRIGIHSGTGTWNGNDYDEFLTVSRAERVMSAASGDQIIISGDAFHELSQDQTDGFISESEGRVTFADLGERRLKDLIQPMKLFQVNSPGLRTEFPPLKTLDAHPNNLPVQLTSFIGREDEISKIRQLMKKSSLLTLTGSGGSGKTRLALQAAADLAYDFRDGVWLSELAQLGDPGLLPNTVAALFGLNEVAGRKPADVLIDYLKKKELLIILDNCEHLIDSAAFLAEKLLINCQGIKILATSREALKINGEVIHRVNSLAMPDPSGEITIENVMQYESVRLFVERALAVDRTFQANNSNAAALAGICHQLDGIPLAIELAAARVRVLKLELINERLNDRFRLLTGGKRTVLPRQQTLRAMIDWSYDLLNEKEKLLFHRLSVFSGGWSVEAAEEICSDESLESYEVIDILTGLLDKSLVTTREDSEGMRFGILESIRQYSAEKAGDDPDTNLKHLKYFKDLVMSYNFRGGTLILSEWLNSLDTERDNIRKAFKWSSENSPRDAFDLANYLTDYWQIKGYFLEGYQACRRLLDIPDGVDPLDRASLMLNTGTMAYALGKVNEVETLANEGLAIYREMNDKAGIANGLNLIGVVANMDPARTGEAFDCLNESLEMFRELNSKYDIANTLYNLSYTFRLRPDMQKVEQYRHEALALFREVGNTYKVALLLASIGIHERTEGNLEEAKSHSEESLLLVESIGDKYLKAINLINLGCISSELNETEEALRLFETAKSISEEQGYTGNVIPILYFMGLAYRRAGEPAKALDSFMQSVLLGADSGIYFYFWKNICEMGLAYFDNKEMQLSADFLAFVNSVFDDTSVNLTEAEKDKAKAVLEELKRLIGEEEIEKIEKSKENISKEEIISLIKDLRAKVEF